MLFLKLLPLLLGYFCLYFFASAGKKKKSTRIAWRTIGFIILLLGLYQILSTHNNVIPSIEVTLPKAVDLPIYSKYTYGYSFQLNFKTDDETIKDISFLPKNKERLFSTLLSCVMNDTTDVNKPCLKYRLDRVIIEKQNDGYLLDFRLSSYKPIQSFSDGITIEWQNRIIKPKQVRKI